MRPSILYLLLGAIFIGLLASCRADRRAERLLLQADSLLSVCPDSAQTLLHVWADSIDRQPEDIRMYYNLLRIKADDKTYVTHTSDSLILKVVHYYKKSRDKRLLPEALYYAGRTYSDLKDAPRALEYYQRAIDVMQREKLTDYNKSIKTYEFGGSATTLALVAAVKLGFAKVIFAGLDMAFKDGVMYSTGETVNKISDSKMTVSNAQKNIVKVKSVTGDMVETRDDYAAFIQHFVMLIKDLKYKEIYNTTSFGADIEGMKNQSFETIPLGTLSNGTPIILGEVSPFTFDIKAWSQEELLLINNVISILSKGMFSPALVSAIVKSPLLYQYMQAEILKVMQAKMKLNLRFL